MAGIVIGLLGFLLDDVLGLTPPIVDSRAAAPPAPPAPPAVDQRAPGGTAVTT